jgi:serine/threonine protein kinase/formylglycine-generating enzyme required for sulfatase activity
MSINGQCIGKYQLLEELGHGGFAQVYKARDMVLNREVAIKILYTHFANEQNVAKRFWNEARGAANLDHPNIVTVYEVAEEKGSLYIAMQYLPGCTLQALLEKKGKLTLEEALPILEQIASALDYAHRQGLIHRDIKPANIMVDERETGFHVTLTDFGLVKVLASDTVLTSMGVMLGTPQYMSPEQLDPAQANEISYAADLYALGIVTYQMLTGQVPFSGSTPAILNAHLNIAPSDPRDVVEGMPDEVANAILKMLAKSSEDRFPTAHAFVQSLAASLAGDRIDASERDQRRKMPIWVWGSGSLILVALLLFVIAPWLGVGGLLPPVATNTFTVTLPVTITEPTKAIGPVVEPSETAEPTTASTPTPTSDPSGFKVIFNDAASASEVMKLERGKTFTKTWQLQNIGTRLPQDTVLIFNSDALIATKERIEIGVVEANATMEIRVAMIAPDQFGFYQGNWKLQVDDKLVEGGKIFVEVQVEGMVGDTKKRSQDGMVMNYVPSGEFQMGDARGSEGEGPIVVLDAFWIDHTEVTNQQYERCVLDGACEKSRCANDERFNGSQQPVICVDWQDAYSYCEWANARLPTEAEWEYAACGPQEALYPWGDVYDSTRVNHCDINCTLPSRDEVNDGFAYTAPVGSFPQGQSWCLVQDLSGNVWEWVYDWYGPYPPGRQENPTGVSSGNERGVRGGSWRNSDAVLLSCVNRGKNVITLVQDNVGFRCAVSIE